MHNDASFLARISYFHFFYISTAANKTQIKKINGRSLRQIQITR